jgi:inner membrane protein
MSPSVIWLIVGFGLILLEFALPGVILVFFGLGAWVVSALLLAGLISSFTAQIAWFSLTSLAFLFGLRRFCKAWFVGSSESGNADQDREFIGKSLVVGQDMVAQQIGKVQFKGSSWSAVSPVPISAGTTATIVGRDGLCLILSPNV